jgi:thioredoxin reductase (NADPH)
MLCCLLISRYFRRLFMDNLQAEKTHLLIIGSGPAGYTAAIYASRANLKPILYQGIQPGGQLTITTEVENYPGFPEGVQGPELMIHFEKQAQRMGADLRYGLATKVDFSQQPYKVWIDDEKLIEADAVIIATGASAKWLGIESEQRLNGYGAGLRRVRWIFLSWKGRCDCGSW